MTTPHSLAGSNQAHGAEQDGGRSESGGEGEDGDGARGRPFIIEFAGTPRAGKTTTLHGLKLRLEERGCRVAVVEERARVCPVPVKRHPDFNLWTASATMAGIVEARYAMADVVLVDRGPFDALAWMEWFRCRRMLLEDEHESNDSYLRWQTRRMVDLVLVMTVTPSEALNRELAGGPRRTPGPIMNSDALCTINDSIAAVMARSGPDVPLVHLDTTHTDQAQTLDLVSEALDSRPTVRLPVLVD